MATASVTNTFVAAATASSAAVNTNFSDIVSFLNNSVVHVDGSKAMTGDLAMGSNKITGLATPTADTDGATKVYVDDNFAADGHSHSDYLATTGGTLTGTLAARSVTPSTDLTYDLGSSTLAWRRLYVGDIYDEANVRTIDVTDTNGVRSYKDLMLPAGTSADTTVRFVGMATDDGLYGDGDELGVSFNGERSFSVHDAGSAVVARATDGQHTRPFEINGNGMSDTDVAIRVYNADGTTDITFAELKAIG